MMVWRELQRALRLTALLWVLTVVVFTLPLLGLGQTLASDVANGSLIRVDNRVVGSRLLGQSFQRDDYFWPRPSAVAYGAEGLSGASNLAPSNPQLVKRVQAEVERLERVGFVDPAPDLLLASGSGLDPHISPEAALQQVERVARARQLPPAQLRQLVQKQTEGRFLGVFGEPRVNVLSLNLALDGLGR